MGRIFLSYAREDRVSAERLARVLEERGHEVWWDRRIDGGEEFSAEIEEALEQSQVVLVAWSKESIKSRWVRDEAAAGCDRGRLVPVSIDGTRPPMGFRQFHTIDLTGWKGSKRDGRTTELGRSVEQRLNGKQKQREGKSPPARRRPFASLRPRWALAVAVFVLIAAGAGYFLLTRGSRTARRQPLTVALLPFTATSTGGELKDIAAQSGDFLSHALSQSGLIVRSLSERPADLHQAGDLVISGELSRNAGKALATVRMDDVAHGVTVFTRRFETNGTHVEQLPERIGAQMAGTIAWAAPLIELEIRHPSDPSVTADLVRQLDFLADPLQGYQASKRAAAKDPNSAFAQISLAFAAAFNLGQVPREERAAAVAEARAAADRAVKLAPEFGDAYSVSCYLRSETLRVDCEDRLRAAHRINPDSPFVDAFLSQLLRTVGRFEEAGELAQLTYTRDPYVPTKIGWMLRRLETNGANSDAEKLYQQGARWWPEFRTNYVENRLLPLLERGDWPSIRRLEQSTPADIRPSGYRDSAALYAALSSRSEAAVRRACAGADEYWLKLRCLVAYATVGDLNSAFALADKLYPNRIGRTPAETERIWLDAPDASGPLELITSPAAAPLRSDPRYLTLAERTGLLAYWRSGRLPDFCTQPTPKPICVRLRRG